MTRCFIALFAALVLVLGWPSAPVSAAGTFACNKAGGSQVVIDACGARWSAANLRVHIAAKQYGGSDVACLTRMAATLDALAAKWLGSGASGSYTLPCGKLPAVASADDGLLATACPESGWSYANRGEAKCDTSIAHLRAHSAASVAHAPGTSPSGPTLDETFQWLNTNFPSLVHFDYDNNGSHGHEQSAFGNDGCLAHWVLDRNFYDIATNAPGEATHVIADIPLQSVDPQRVGYARITAGATEHYGPSSVQIFAYLLPGAGNAVALSFTEVLPGGDPTQFRRTSNFYSTNIDDASDAARIVAALKNAVSLCAAAQKASPF
jgi:hypothetical protein